LARFLCVDNFNDFLVCVNWIHLNFDAIVATPPRFAVNTQPKYAIIAHFKKNLCATFAHFISQNCAKTGFTLPSFSHSHASDANYTPEKRPAGAINASKTTL